MFECCAGLPRGCIYNGDLENKDQIGFSNSHLIFLCLATSGKTKSAIWMEKKKIGNIQSKGFHHWDHLSKEGNRQKREREIDMKREK